MEVLFAASARLAEAKEGGLWGGLQGSGNAAEEGEDEGRSAEAAYRGEQAGRLGQCLGERHRGLLTQKPQGAVNSQVK